MPKKTNSKLISISELVKKIGLTSRNSRNPPTHTIRYWEKEFKNINPKILSGKRRYYDNKEIEKLKTIQFLLKKQGLTIKGVKIYLKNKSFNLDEPLNNSININKKDVLVNKINKISKLIKSIKKK